MWLLAVCVPLLPAVLLVYGLYRSEVWGVCEGVAAWARRLGRGRVCVRSTHAFVFANCTHGRADSVLQTLELYAETHPSLGIGPQTGEVLDEVLRSVQPLCVLELGTHCGYSSVRMLRLLPPAGRLLTVELDPLTAELGEEVILVAGFKHSQFQVLTCSSAEAIRTLHSHLDPGQGTRPGIDLVLMDHDPQQYLPDLLALEREELLSPAGCSVVLIKRGRRAGELRGVLDHIRGREDCYEVKRDRPSMVEIFYRNESTTRLS